MRCYLLRNEQVVEFLPSYVNRRFVVVKIVPIFICYRAHTWCQNIWAEFIGATD